jgi:hypothetical protein
MIGALSAAVLPAVLTTLLPVARAGVDVPLSPDVFVPLGAPALAGDNLLWAQRRGSGFELMQRTSSGTVRSVLSRQGTSGRRAYARLEASPSHFVLETSQSVPSTCVKCDPPLPLLTIEAGTLGGIVEPLGSTCEYDSTLYERPIDVDGDSFAVHGPQCRHWTAGTFRGDGSPEFAPLPDRIVLPRVAGRFVAWLELETHSASQTTGDVVVRDRDSNSEVYRLPRASIDFLTSLSLREDGTVALSTVSSDKGARAAWASPAEPFLHPVGAPGDGYDEVRIAGDLIGYHRTRLGLSGAAGVAPHSYVSEVGTLTLAGTDRIAGTGVATAFDVFGSRGARFDFDGRKVAWASAGCKHATVHVRTVGDELVSSPQSCPLRLAAAPRLRDGQVRFRLDCAGFGRRCRAGTVEMTTPSPGGHHVLVALLRHTSAGPFVTVPLTAAGARAFRRRANRVITISAGIGGPSGRSERRSARFRMRP